MTTQTRKMSFDTTATVSTSTESLRSSTSSVISRSILRSEDSSRSLGSCKKRVSFDSVDVCEHAITLGDNVVSEGAPLTIEWHAQSCDILSVDQYERDRPPNRPLNNKPRKLSADERFCMLSLSGIPMRTSLQAAAEASKMRLSRQETVDEVIREQDAELMKEKRKGRKSFFRGPKAIWSKLRAR